MLTLSASEALHALIHTPSEFGWIDVRSEGEFIEAHLPFFTNAPILNDQERILVGTAYKKEGNERATALGHDLVRENRAARETQWIEIAQKSKSKKAIVACWRGGQRSKITCDWLEKRSQPTIRVEGGYKAMRAVLLSQLERLPPLLVISGLTGSGKTNFIHLFPKHSVDLEGHAHHRGSTFGIRMSGEQPHQATFENRVFLDFMRGPKEFLVEDESIRIGQVSIPLALKKRMIESPVVWIDSTTEERARSIAKEYVADCIAQGFDAEAVFEKLNTSILMLRKKLGAQFASELRANLKKSFEQDPLALENHFSWIEPLLVQYYDKLYTYSFNRNPRSVLFKGNQKECQLWIQSRLNLPKQ